MSSAVHDEDGHGGALVVALATVQALVEGRHDEARSLLDEMSRQAVAVLAGLAASYALSASSGNVADAADRLAAARRRVLAAGLADTSDLVALLERLDEP